MMQALWTVYRKELVDALRDRRTLISVILSSVAVGPLVLVLISTMISGIEQRADAREVLAAGGAATAPTLRNYLERQNLKVVTAPADFEQRLLDKSLGDPVLVAPADFEARLAAGEAPVVEVVYNSAHQGAQSGLSRLERVLSGFNNERAGVQLALRGVSTALVRSVQVESRDLANPQTRGAVLTGMLPFFVLMAVLYGALNAALDTTAGERERGSLEPLLMTPAAPWTLVAGKWGAVATLAMAIAVLSCLSFLPGQWLLKSETLAAMFQFGPREVVLFLLVLLPLAAAISAVIMAVAVRSRSFKEAQASNTIVVLGVSLLPLVNVVQQGAEAPWYRFVPALSQSTLMGQVLRGETPAPADLAISAGVAVVLVVLTLGWVVHHLRRLATQ